MKYYLDVKTWRCGGDSPNRGNRHGEGPTLLLNGQGYSCCLGQFSQQTVNIPPETGFNSPGELAQYLGQEYDDAFVYPATGQLFFNTPLSCELMDINDDSETSVETKIKLIREKLERDGHKLEVIE